ncbi:hypothetical protein [Thalassomonas actiniarum]|uniref:Uncharacterized protein n=1 Tax=Thalassomonas actiniarum TaxID=485447 RepID=A0AAE9YU37_9GAMM|nr:hypothetical protein [Thalassomonas actiniarum]WDD99527.1 hypothetical protein SG35_002275 [Thalassomonas actiniarum]
MSDNLITKGVKGPLNNPLVRGLIQLIPGGSSLDVLAQERLSQIETERFNILIKALEEGELDLTEDILNSNEFLHAFVKTSRATVQTYRREKIQLLAELFTATFKDNQFNKIDEYEELLSVIDDLSVRELNILSLLDSFEQKHPVQKEENELQRSDHYWGTFIETVENEFSLNRDELKGVLVRLQRSGLYAPFEGNYWDYEGGRGFLSALYYKLRHFILHSIESGTI